MSVFRYSGSKSRLLKFLPSPPVTVVAEPFAGSLAYSMGWRPSRILAAEANPLVRDLWEWLRTEATVSRLQELELSKPVTKVDLRSLGFREEETTLLRLMISGVYTGQLSSYIAYPQHRLDLQKLREALPYIQASLKPVMEDYQELVCGPDTLLFVDPPYLGTSANYVGRKQKYGDINPGALQEYVLQAGGPVLITYGDGAQETFPQLSWKKATTRKVPRIRGGGVVERTEWYATLNWDIA